MRKFLTACVLLMTLVLSHRQWLPPRWDPTQPLDLRAAPNAMTSLKMSLLSADPALCRAALATSPLRVAPVPDTRGACPLHDAVRIEGGPVATEPTSFLASCRLAVAWSLFLTDAVLPAAQARYGEAVSRVDHLGSYACRDIRDAPGRQSAHARADAIDVSGFVLADGRHIPVSDWHGAQGGFLHEVRDRACRWFGIVLSPDYNALHAGHLHLQADGFGLCD